MQHNMNSSAMVSLQAPQSSFPNQQDMAKINQQNLFNDYVNVGISHRIASGLSSKISGLVQDNYRNLPKGKQQPPDSPEPAMDRTKSLHTEDDG